MNACGDIILIKHISMRLSIWFAIFEKKKKKKPKFTITWASSVARQIIVNALLSAFVDGVK